MLDLDHINQVSLSKKMSHIINGYSELKKIFKNSRDIQSFIFKIVNTRNYYTHHDNRLKDKIIQGEDLYSAVKKLQLILHFYLLILVGLRPEQLALILKRFQEYQSLFIRK